MLRNFERIKIKELITPFYILSQRHLFRESDSEQSELINEISDRAANQQ